MFVLFMPQVAIAEGGDGSAGDASEDGEAEDDIDFDSYLKELSAEVEVGVGKLWTREVTCFCLGWVENGQRLGRLDPRWIQPLDTE